MTEFANVHLLLNLAWTRAARLMYIVKSSRTRQRNVCLRSAGTMFTPTRRSTQKFSGKLFLLGIKSAGWLFFSCRPFSEFDFEFFMGAYTVLQDRASLVHAFS
jgi:hypothetical protein